MTRTATANNSTKYHEGRELPPLLPPVQVLFARLPRTLAGLSGTAHHARSHLRKLPVLTVLALLSSPIYGQSVAERGTVEGFLKGIIRLG